LLNRLQQTKVDSNDPDNEGFLTSGSAKSESNLDKLDEESVDPTRYGDWEKDGRCIDF